MQFWNKSRICFFPRHESVSGETEVETTVGFRRMAAARAARAWARSSLSSLEPIANKGLFIGENGAFCFGFGLKVSPISGCSRWPEFLEI